MMIATIVTLFCMIKTTQKGNDDRTCDKKPTFYENCNLSTGIMKLFTNQNNPSKLPSLCIKNLIPPKKKVRVPLHDPIFNHIHIFTPQKKKRSPL